MMELFCESTIFAIKAPSQIFDWIIYRPPKNQSAQNLLFFNLLINFVVLTSAYIKAYTEAAARCVLLK